jgi:Rrf2 family protein
MISKTGLNALKALATLASLDDNEYMGANVIAEKIDAPRNYLGKILGTLAREGIVISQKGSGGGVRLVSRPEKISLFDALEPIEHLSEWTTCFFRDGSCRDKCACSVHSKWGPVRDQYLKFLKTTTIADLTDDFQI